MKKKYSTLLNFALATCVATALVACSDGDSTGPLVSKDSNPTVNIGGNVLDTNGNPLAGVTVSCEGKQAKTNSSGQYNITNLRVINVAGGRDDTTNAYDNYDQPVQCIVEAPEGYLGGQVFVYPEAQVSNNLYDNTSEGQENTNQPLIWTEGMFAQAATMWLPKLDSEVCGVLRYCETGEPVMDAQLRLDMWAVDNNDVDEQANAHGYTSEIGYSNGLYQTSTDGMDDDGMVYGSFCISDVPDDSILRLYAPMYQDLYVSGNGYADVSFSCSGTKPCNNEGAYITTTNEGLVNLGNVCVSSIPAGDSIRPCVASIEGWTARDGRETVWGFHHGSDQLRYAVLNDELDGTQGIDIGFNELLDCAEIDEDGNSVVIWDDDLSDYITAFDLDCSGRTLTVTTDEPIGEDHHVLIYMLVDDFQDLAGNYLTAYDLPSDGACDDVYFAEEFISGKGQWYVAVGVKMFSQDSTDAPAVTDLGPVCKDSVGNGGFPVLTAEYPQTFIDTIDSRSNYQNLSAVDTVHSSEWSDRLEGLADIQGFDSAQVENGWGHVKFMEPSEGVWAPDGFSCYSSWTDDDGMTHCVFSGTAVGATVRINTLDDFFNVSDYAETTMVDCVAPTTIPQFAYNTCGYSFDDQDYADYAEEICLSTNTNAVPEYGDGGENTNEGVPGILGFPTLNVTCRLLKNRADTDVSPIAPNLVNPVDLYGLYDGPNGANQLPPEPEYNEADQLYDSLEYAGFVPFPDTIGVAFSEDIAMSGGPIAWLGDTALESDWSIGNDITSTDDSGSQNPVDGGEGTSVDLAQVTFDDVINLANVDHGQLLGFNAAVEDSNGVAASRASVMINDLMPPFVTRAFWDGDLVIEFNEDITWSNSTGGRCTIRAAGNNYTLDYASDDHVASGQTIDGNTLTITNPANLDKTDFGMGDWEEATYDDLIAAGTDLPHAILNTDCVPDTNNGTTWDMYNGDGGYDSSGMWRNFYDTEDTQLCKTPEFLMVDVIPPFEATISVVSGSFVNNSVDDLVIRIGWNLPLDICTTFPGTFALPTNCSLTGDPAISTDDNLYMNNNWTFNGADIASIATLQITNTTMVNSTNGFVQFTLDNDGSFNYISGDTQQFDPATVNANYTFYTVSNGNEGWILPTLTTQN